MIGEQNLSFLLKSCHSIFEERQGNLFHVRKSHLLRNLLALKKLLFIGNVLSCFFLVSTLNPFHYLTMLRQ